MLPEDVEYTAPGWNIRARRKAGESRDVAAAERVNVGIEIRARGVRIARYDQAAFGERTKKIIETIQSALKPQLQRALRIAFAIMRIIRDVGGAVIDIVAPPRLRAIV